MRDDIQLNINIIVEHMFDCVIISSIFLPYRSVCNRGFTLLQYQLCYNYRVGYGSLRKNENGSLLWKKKGEKCVNGVCNFICHSFIVGFDVQIRLKNPFRIVFPDMLLAYLWVQTLLEFWEQWVCVVIHERQNFMSATAYGEISYI